MEHEHDPIVHSICVALGILPQLNLLGAWTRGRFAGLSKLKSQSWILHGMQASGHCSAVLLASRMIVQGKS